MWQLFRKFMSSPASVGSVMPSSRHLVSAMVSRVDWPQVSRVAELGAGTGVITQAVNEARRPDSRFSCFERDTSMREALKQRFRDIDFHDDAFALCNTVAPAYGEGLDCVISGLPFANFSPWERERLLRDVYTCLNPGGVFLAFQYSRVLQPCLASVYGKYESRLVWANMPPALVFYCRKELVTAGELAAG